MIRTSPSDPVAARLHRVATDAPVVRHPCPAASPLRRPDNMDRALIAHRVTGSPVILANLVFRQLFDAASSTYTYVLGDPRTRAAVVIDPVFEQHLRDHALLGELGLEAVAAIDTHCHADHVTGAWLMREATGCRIGISRRYRPPIDNADLLLDRRRSRRVRRPLPRGARNAGTHRRLHDARARQRKRRLHGRRTADTGRRALRFPARERERAVPLDRAADLLALRRVPDLSGPRLQRPRDVDRRRGKGAQPAHRHGRRRARFRRVHGEPQPAASEADRRRGAGESSLRPPGRRRHSASRDLGSRAPDLSPACSRSSRSGSRNI